MVDTDQQLLKDQQQATQEAALLEQAEYANQLALDQEASYLDQMTQQEANSLLEEGRSFGNPSMTKYLGVLVALAIPNDLIDLAQLVGWLPQTIWITALVWFVSLAISAITIFVFWFTDTQYKSAKNYAKNLEKRVAIIASNLARLEGNAIRGARAVGKVPGMARAGARLEKTVVRVAKKVGGSPTMKSIYGTVAEFLPFVSILPFSSISVLWSYMDDRKSRKAARESAEEAYKQLSQSAAEVV